MKVYALVLVLLAAVACGDDSAHPHAGGAGHMSTHAFGAPGDPDAADSSVEVATMDSLKFDPPELEVDAGETVTFEITNDGATDHEFVLGDAAYQKAHGPATEGMMHGGNGVFLEPGATETLTWTFSEPGEVLYACHVAGHYEAGMVGRITVR